MTRKSTSGLKSLATINRSELDDSMLRNNSRFDNRLVLEMQRFDRDMKTMARELDKDFKMFAQKTGVFPRTKTTLGPKALQREKTVMSIPPRFIPDFEYRARKREKTRMELETKHALKHPTEEPKDAAQGQGEQPVNASTAAPPAPQNTTQHHTSNTPSIITGGVTSRMEEAGPDERSSAHKAGRGHGEVRTGRRSTEQVGGDVVSHAHDDRDSVQPKLPLDAEGGDTTEGELDWQESGRASKFSVWSSLSVPKHRNTALAVRERLSKEFAEGGPKQSPTQKPSARHVARTQVPVQSLHLANQRSVSFHLQGKAKGQSSNPARGQGHVEVNLATSRLVPPSNYPRQLGPLRGGRGKLTPRGVEGPGGIMSSTTERRPSVGMDPLATPRALGMTLPLPAVTGTHMQRQRRDSVVSVKNG